MPDILLTTLNARYSHASLGLRYLMANMGPLREHTEIAEFVIGLKTAELAERLLAHAPRIIGLGVYIWNVEESTRLVALLKRIAPEVVLVLGGPEVSYEVDEQAITALADYVITGWGEVSFPRLCGQILAGKPTLPRISAGEQPPLAALRLPYDEYSDADIALRNIYVEASRGCPFKCEFCLSALDKTAWPFALDEFLAAMARLYERGARRFKFVDRTFNLKVDTSARILDFFYQRITDHPEDAVFAHFELVPDHLPEALKQSIARFPPGCLQFEIGIQTFNPQVQALISRRQDNQRAEDNLRWLRTHSHAHLHVDLIAGLPGEDLASFAQGFNRLVALGPHEIQLGILKRLRGTPIVRHTAPFAMVYDPYPPYALLANDRIAFSEMQQMARFARYWDLVANSGRYADCLPALLGNDPFARFMAFSLWLFQQTDVTGGLAPERLRRLLNQWLTVTPAGENPAGEAVLPAPVRRSRELVSVLADQRQRRHREADGP